MEKTKELIPAIGASIRLEVGNVGKDLRELLKDKNYLKVFKLAVVDIVGRTSTTSTD